jgi:hypothetical protein
MEGATGASFQIPMENAIHLQTIVQMEQGTQICAIFMAVAIAVSTSIQTTKVVPNRLLLGQTCALAMAEGIVVSTLTTMDHASHLQLGAVVAQDSLGVVSNMEEATGASTNTMMGRFAIVLQHVEIPIAVITTVAGTFVNTLRMV